MTKFGRQGRLVKPAEASARLTQASCYTGVSAAQMTVAGLYWGIVAWRSPDAVQTSAAPSLPVSECTLLPALAPMPVFVSVQFPGSPVLQRQYGRVLEQPGRFQTLVASVSLLQVR